MEMNIHKLAAWLEEVCREGIAEEQVILEWRLAGKPANRTWMRAAADGSGEQSSTLILAKAS